jgi:hypothetical protein
MPALRDVQASIAAALLGGDTETAAGHIEGDGLEPGARLQIYRHHVLTTLTAALEVTFPVVCRLVDRRFFAYAADAYIRQNPPAGPCLAEYGESFPAFLARFRPCRPHRYLPDVARLEWAISVALRADESAGIDTARLAAVPPEDVPRLVFRLDSSVSFIHSPWPIDRIWRANQEEAGGEDPVDLQGGGVHLEVRRVGGEATMRAVSAPRHAFRRALGEGLPLGDAAAAALALDPSLDLTGEIRQLLEDQLATEFTLSAAGPRGTRPARRAQAPPDPMRGRP